MGGSVPHRLSHPRRDLHLNDNGGEDSPLDLACVKFEEIFCLRMNRRRTMPSVVQIRQYVQIGGNFI
ncbi:hypothetical protein B296_00048321 [Ensete ventricosum]|uniref:Uncharacterized protein n=1 Tax=Ensete ventricosum TaxID=4639 RepID=A0A426X204_ENSVE|nr:hypothetical protein B296_00048321 [Ensete ventricosum]